MKKIKQYLIVSLAPLIFLALILSVLGVNWGWVDDVFYANNFQALTTSQPIYDPDYFVGISKLLIFLYAKIPSIAWLGYFLCSLMILVFIQTNAILIRVSNVARQSVTIQLFYALLLAIVFASFIFRLNFTITAIFSVSIGLLYLDIYQKNQLRWLGFVLFCLGFLIRWHVAVLFIAIHLLYVFFGYAERTNRFQVLKRKPLIFVVVGLIFIGIFVSTLNKDVIKLHETTPYEWIVQDAYILGKGLGEVSASGDLLKRQALQSWNTQDGEVLNVDYYQELLSTYEWSLGNLTSLLFYKLKLALDFSSRYSGKHAAFNWQIKFVLLILLFIAVYLATERKKGKAKYLALNFLIMLAVIFFVKSEDRFVLPFLVITVLHLLILYYPTNTRAIPVKTRVLLASVLAVFNLFLIYNSYKQSMLLKEDLANKKMFINELNQNIHNKTVLFDAFTPYMLQLSPFENVKLNPSNSYSLALHYGRNNFLSINNHFSSDKAAPMPYAEVMEAIRSQKEDIVFVYTTFNIDFLQRWNKTFYGKADEFTTLFDGSELSKTTNAYLWNTMRMDYYKLN